MDERKEVADQLDTRTNYEWFLDAITTAMSMERLTMLSHDIAIDKEAGVDYTTDEEQLETLRQRWRERSKFIQETKAANVKQS